MAADIAQIISNLREFHNVADRVILWIGAGGGQFIEYGRTARHVIAVDIDAEALGKLRDTVTKSGLTDEFELVQSDYFLVQRKADVVFFEFCLHEIPDPGAAIRHALTLAPCVLIADHWPESDWSYIVDEAEKVTRSWGEIKSFYHPNIQAYDSVQFFHTYDDLYQKVKSQGLNSINRIEKYREMLDFTIPMSYGFALIRREAEVDN